MSKRATHSRSSHTPRSSRTLRVAALFSLPISRERDAERSRLERARSHALKLLGPLASSSSLDHASITLIHGASGSGKSTLLDALSRECVRGRCQVRRVEASILGRARGTRRRAIVDLSPRPLATWLRILASCGLAEAPMLSRRASELSTGQAWRLSLAAAIASITQRASRSSRSARALPPRVLIIDELCAGLDDITARGLCRTLRQLARHGLIIFAATSSPDRLRRSLAPDREIELAPLGDSRPQPIAKVRKKGSNP